VRLEAISLAALCAIALGGCGDTLQDRPVPHNLLESMIVAPAPVYWLGASFQGLAITDAVHDPGGAFTVQYGDCLEGGQATCVPRCGDHRRRDTASCPGGPGGACRARCITAACRRHAGRLAAFQAVAVLDGEGSPRIVHRVGDRKPLEGGPEPVHRAGATIMLSSRLCGTGLS